MKEEVKLSMSTDFSKFMHSLEQRNPGQPEYLQAVYEVLTDVIPWLQDNPKYDRNNLLERICEPDRIIQFKVSWEDDQGNVHVNRGYRVQGNNAIGPYKGGLRFHPSVNVSILKFLAFEQTFKNSLTGMPLGAGKGGSDFDPKGKSDSEIRRFCQAFITALLPFIGKDKDVPAGDIGVGSREISYMFGQMKRIASISPGILTGKSVAFGGSNVRLEATGFGTVYFLKHMLSVTQDNLRGKNVLVSGSGNVALFAAQKLIDLGAKVITLSDSKGFLHIPDGLNQAQLDDIMHLRFAQHKPLAQALQKYPQLSFYPGKTPWHMPADIVLPCATENEIDMEDAKALSAGGVVYVAEGANMPVSPAAIKFFNQHNVVYAPGKAANAGGVAVSGLEMSQNAMGYSWSHAEVDAKLQVIMENIHNLCVQFSGHEPNQVVNYARGANIAGFKKVADAMLAFGF